MVLVEDLLGAAILCTTYTEKPCSGSSPLQETRHEGSDVVGCCGTLDFETV